MNAEGLIYPVAYVRRGPEIEERTLPPEHLHRFDAGEYERELEALL
jgi:hypothetical protein